MAKPTRPIEIWAVKDIVLPVSKRNNKVRPIDDLWSKGYDKTQKPGAEEWNYIWNMTTSWLKYISDEQIPELDNRFLQIANNLSDLGNVAAARKNLDVYSKKESEDRYVNTEGDTMTGTLNLPRLSFTKKDTTDFAYIEANTTGVDKTYLDFVIGDNGGDPSGSSIDIMRWRFQPSSSGTLTSMMELNSKDGINSYLRIFGELWARTATIAGEFTWTGAGKGASLVLTGAFTAASARTNSLVVVNNSATVGGRNIVRSVNGATADANGNVNINPGVQDVRWTGVSWISSSSFNAVYANGTWSSTTTVPAGAVVVNMADYRIAEANPGKGEKWLDTVDGVGYRFLQKQVNGVWYTVGTL